MSTIIPSPISGLGDAALLFTQLRRQKREEESEEAREQRQLAMQEQAAAMDRLINFLPLIPGKSIAEVPYLHDDIRTVFPGSDPADLSPTGLGSLVATPETIEQALAPAIINRFRQLQRENPEEFEGLVDLGIATRLTGEPTSAEERELGEIVAETQIEALEKFKTNPDTLSAISRRILGLPETTRVKFPGGETMEYGSPQEAQLAVSVFNILTDAQIRREQFQVSSQGDRLALARDLRDTFNEVSPEGASIGLGAAMRVVGAIHGENPSEALDAIWQEEETRKAREGIPADVLTPVQAAARLYIGGIRTASTGLAALGDLPEVQGLQIVGELGDIFEGLPVEERQIAVTRSLDALRTAIESTGGDASIIPTTDKAFRIMGFGISPDRPIAEDPFGRREDLLNSLEQSVGAEQRTVPATAPGTPMPPADAQADIGRTPGASTIETELQRATALAQALATGQITLAQLRQVVGADPEMLRAIQATAAQMRGGR